MRWADIEVPNDPVDKSSKGSLACYPRRTFYPLSDSFSIQNYRITTAGACCAPVKYVHLAVKWALPLRLFFGNPKKTHHCAPPVQFGRLPPQQNYHSYAVLVKSSRLTTRQTRFIVTSRIRRDESLIGHVLPYKKAIKRHRKTVVKVHGVFPSCCLNFASARRIQFR